MVKNGKTRKDTRKHKWNNNERVPMIFSIFLESNVHIMDLCFIETSLLQLVSLDMFDFVIQMRVLFVNQRQ